MKASFGAERSWAAALVPASVPRASDMGGLPPGLRVDVDGRVMLNPPRACCQNFP